MKFLVLWDHPSTPEGAGNALDLVKEDLRKGTIKEWGAFTAGKGFVLLEVENEAQAFKETRKYRKYGIQFLSSEIYFTVEEVEKMYST